MTQIWLIYPVVFWWRYRQDRQEKDYYLFIYLFIYRYINTKYENKK